MLSKKIVYACALLLIQTCNPVIILIHGTFAAGGEWARPGGKFYTVLEQQVQKYKHKLVPFTWTGGATHQDRFQGAQALAKVILSYPSDEEKIVIGHSHAGNVIAIASQLLSDPVGKIMKNTDPEKTLQELINFMNKQYELLCKDDEIITRGLQSSSEKRKYEWAMRNLILTTYLNISNEKQMYDKKNMHKEQIRGISSHEDSLIQKAYFIATPVDTENYMPDMDVIKTLFNFYSKGDVVQPVFGFYSRLFPEHNRIANFRVTIENSGMFSDDPSHSEMHDPVVAQWILDIPYALKKNKVGSFEQYIDYRNGKIHFDANDNPHFKIDKKTTQEREHKEKNRIQQASSAFFSFFR